MSKLIILLFVASLGCKWLFGRWPWEILGLRQTNRSQAIRDMTKARSLLGVTPQATHAEIIEAHKRLLVRVHPDRGGSEALVYEANDARDLLLARVPRVRA